MDAIALAFGVPVPANVVYATNVFFLQQFITDLDRQAENYIGEMIALDICSCDCLLELAAGSGAVLCFECEGRPHFNELFFVGGDRVCCSEPVSIKEDGDRILVKLLKCDHEVTTFLS